MVTKDIKGLANDVRGVRSCGSNMSAKLRTRARARACAHTHALTCTRALTCIHAHARALARRGANEKQNAREHLATPTYSLANECAAWRPQHKRGVSQTQPYDVIEDDNKFLADVVASNVLST